MEAMARHRSHSVEFQRQVAQEYLAGETLHGLAKRHDISRNLIRIWVDKYEAGTFDDDAQAADLIQAHEARIAALERLVGKQALELELSQRGLGASDHGREARPCPSSPAPRRLRRGRMPPDGDRVLHPLRRAEASCR
jgi:transposase